MIALETASSREVVPAPKFENGVLRVPLTESYRLFDWPIDQLSYPAHYWQTGDHPLYAKAIAAIAVVVFSVLSLGYYAFYAYRAHTDRWLIREFCHRVAHQDVAKVRELFDKYPELKTRKLMYALNPSGIIEGSKSALFLAVSGGSERSQPILNELLKQEYDFSAPVDHLGRGIVETFYLAGGDSTKQRAFFLTHGASRGSIAGH